MKYTTFEKACTFLLICALLSFLMTIGYLNFHVTPSTYISDMYADILFSVQMWEHKSFLPDNWVFGNQIYICATPAIASVFYGITHSPFLAMGIASFCMTVVQLLCLDYLLRAVSSDWRERLLGLLLYLGLPAMTGDVVRGEESWQLLFTMCSYYGCYAATAFLCYGVWLRGDKHVPPLLSGIACLFSFATGLQSVRQTLIMTIPLILTETLRWLFLRKTLCARRTKYALWICFSNLLGVLSRQFLSYRRHEIYGSFRLLPPTQWFKSLADSFHTMVTLLFPKTVFPLWAVLLICAALAVFFLWILYRISRQEQPGSRSFLLLLVLFFSVFSVCAADILTKLSVRSIYYFMLYPLLDVLIVFGIRFLRNRWKSFCLLLILFSLLAAGVQHVLPVCQQAWYRMDDPEWAISKALTERGYTTVFSHWNGCETLAAASGGALQAGFWYGEETPFEMPVTWLCDPGIFDVNAQKCVFVFYGEAEQALCLRKLEDAGISAQLVTQYYSERHYSNIFLYELSQNVLTAHAAVS